ncbi:MAG TPA: DUF4349 domain-containing protein, partial [Planctomycetota bacterium]|nr:DUF4349 domain-containing protein [Planctomycetota bacterium]
MNVHDEIETLTDVYLAGGLEADERRGVEEHAAGCEKCAAILRDAREFHGWMRGASSSGAPPSNLEERIIERLHAASPKSRRFPGAPRLIRIFAGLAAVFALIVLGGIFTSPSKDSPLPRLLHALPSDLRVDGYFSEADARAEGELQNQEGARYGGRAGAKGGERRRELGELKSKDMAGFANRPTTAAPAPAEAPAVFAAEKRMAESMDKAPEGDESLRKADAEGKTGEPGNPYIDDRKIIRNAELHIEVEKYEDAYAKVSQIAVAEKGFVAGANTTRLANGKMRADIIIRIPPDRFEGVVNQLKALGTLRNQAITSQDITKQYLDLATRQKSKEAL